MIRALRAGVDRGVGAIAESLLAAAAGWPKPAPPPAEPRSIFVLRNNGVGDLLLATPLLEALARRFPRSEIAVGVAAWNLETLRHDPFVSEVIQVDAPWFNWAPESARLLPRWRYLAADPQVRALGERRFEIGIDVLGSRWGAALLLRAGIPYRVGVAGYAGGHRACQASVPYDPAEHVGQASLRFARLLGADELPSPRPRLHLSAEERAAAEARWRSLGKCRRPGARRIVIAPGGGHPSKCWPAAAYRALAAALAANGTAEVAVVGGPLERALAELFGAAEAPWTYLDELGLRECFALVAQADLAVSNTSMLMHAAAAVGTPVVALLGDSVSDAAAHDRQWGYSEGYRSLGKGPGGRTTIASPEEAFEAVTHCLAATGARR